MAGKETFMFNQFAFFPWQSCRGCEFRWRCRCCIHGFLLRLLTKCRI